MKARSKFSKQEKTIPSTASFNPKKKNIRLIFNKKWAFLIFVFAFALYANTLKNEYALDDDIVVVKNADVQSGIKGIKSILTHSFIYGFTGHNDQSYRPFVLITYAIEKEFFGNNPSTRHFINVLLFSLSCLLLYYLLGNIFSSSLYPAISIYFPLAVTLLFAAHPIHTEAVANIKGRDDVMNFLFFEGSLLFMFKYVDERKIKFLCFSTLFIFLGLLCKEIAVTFIAAIPLTLFFFRKLSIKSIALLTVPLIGTLGVYLLIRSSVLDAVTFAEKMQVINNALAAATNESDRLATAIMILGKYFSLLFFPHPLSWDYSFNQLPIVSFSDIKVLFVIFLFLPLLIYAGFIIIKRLQTNNEPATHVKQNILAYSILFFFITMSVVSNIFILIGSTLGERFLLTPSYAFCLSVAAILFIPKQNTPLRRWKWGLLIIITGLFSYKTFTRNKEWKNNYSLFLSGVQASPNSSRAQSALGSSYREQAEKETDRTKGVALYTQAIQQYKNAIAILPENTEALYNLGVCYYSTGDKANALKVYQQVLTITPEYTNAANNAGVLYFEQKDYKTAQKYFEQALKYAPANADALANLGAIYHNLGNMEMAIEYYKKALVLNPGNQNTRNNLMKAERSIGQ